MAGNAKSLGFSIYGRDEGASSTLKKIGDNAEKASSKVRKLDGQRANVKGDADFSKLEKKIEQTEARLAKLNAEKNSTKLDADIAGAMSKIERYKAALDKLRAERDSPQLDLDIAAEQAKIRKLTADLEKLRSMKATPEVDLKIAQLEQKLGQATTRLDGLNAKKTSPELGLKIAEFEAKIAEAERELEALNAEKANPSVNTKIAEEMAKLAAFKAELASLKSQRTEVPVGADTGPAERNVGALAAKIQTQLAAAIKALPDVELKADSSDADRKIAAIRAEMQTLQNKTIGVDISEADFLATMARLRAELQSLGSSSSSIQVQADTAAASAQLKAISSEADILDRKSVSIKTRIDNSGIESAGGAAATLARNATMAAAAVASIGSAIPAVAGLASALASAAGAAALIPAAIAGGGAMFGALKIGLGGVGDAYKAVTAADTAGGGAASGNAQARIAAAERVKAAQESLADAYRQADRQAIQSAQSIADAQQSLARAQESAARSIADAQKSLARAQQSAAESIASAQARVAQAQANAVRSVESAETALARAQRNAQNAQEALNRAREDATRQLRDMQTSLAGASLDEEAATLALARARERLAKMPRNSTALDWAEAELAVKQAEQALTETQQRYQDLQEDATKAAEKGVEGSDQVKSAQQALDDANQQVADSQKALTQAQLDGAKSVADAQAALVKAQRDGAQSVADAQENLTRAQVDGARQVADAQESLARAQQQAQWQQEDSARSIAKAQEELNKALRDQATAGAAAAGGANKAADALSKISPEARQLVQALKELEPAWKAVKFAVQDALFDGIAEKVKDLAGTYLPVLKDGLSGIAAGFNDGAKQVADFMMESSSVESVSKILDNTGSATKRLADAFAPLVSVFLKFADVGSEFLPGLADGFTKAAERAAAFVNSAEGTQKIRDWIKGGLDTLSQFWELLKNVGGIIGSVFKAADTSGGSFLGTLVKLTGAANDFLKSAKGQEVLKTIFENISKTVDAVLPGLKSLGAALMDAFAKIAPILPQVGTAFSAIASNASPAISLLAELATVILPPLVSLLTLLAPVLGPMAVAWATAAGGVKMFNDAMKLMAPIQQIVSALSGLGTAANDAGGKVAGSAGKFAEAEGATGKLKGGVGLLAGALGAGGPLGIALGVGTVALGLWANKQAEAEQSARNHQSAVDGLASTLDRYSGAVTNATIQDQARELAQRKLSDGTTSLADALNKAGISTTDFVQATSGNSEKLEQINGQLHNQAKSLLENSDLWKTNKARFDEAGVSLDLLADASIGNVQAQDAMRDKLGATANGQEYWNQQLRDTIGPLGEIGSSLGDMAGKLSEAQKQVQVAAQAAADFKGKLTDATSALREFGQSSVDANGNLIAGAAGTEQLRSKFSDLGRDAMLAAQAQGEAAKASGNVAGAGAEAAKSMQESRDAFIKTATEAGLTKIQAEALANQMGLIPAAATTVFQTNAKGATAEIATLKSQFDAVPDAKTVTVNALSDQAKQQLQDLGFTVTTLPNGQVSVDVHDEAGRQKLAEFVASGNAQIIGITVDANTDPATGKITGAVDFGNGQISKMTLDSNVDPATGKIVGTVDLGNGALAKMTLDANPDPATGKVNATVDYGNGRVTTVTMDANAIPGYDKVNGFVGNTNAQRPTPTVDADTSQAQSKTQSWLSSIPQKITTWVQALFSNANGNFMMPMANGGVLQPILPLADGGIPDGRRLTPMSGSSARIVQPNTWRVIGDNMTSPELFVPLNGSKRSDTLLHIGAAAMGYDLVSRKDKAKALASQTATGGDLGVKAKGIVVAAAGGGDVQGAVQQFQAAVAAQYGTSTSVDLSPVVRALGRVEQRIDQARQVNYSPVINNPTGERSADSIAQDARSAAEAGLFR